jgi:hypothetical protein
VVIVEHDQAGGEVPVANDRASRVLAVTMSEQVSAGEFMGLSPTVSLNTGGPSPGVDPLSGSENLNPVQRIAVMTSLPLPSGRLILGS